MKRTLFTLILAAVFTVTAAAQGKSADAIKKQIRDLKADRAITLTYDQGSDSSKVMAIAGNFDQKEAGGAGLQAINFAMAFNFSGRSLTTAPATINLSFWVLTKKPRFATAHTWIVTAGKDTVDLGAPRYAAKASENMEYLNFVLPPDQLKKAAIAGARWKLGDVDFTLTADQAALMTNMLAVATP